MAHPPPHPGRGRRSAGTDRLEVTGLPARTSGPGPGIETRPIRVGHDDVLRAWREAEGHLRGLDTALRSPYQDGSGGPDMIARTRPGRDGPGRRAWAGRRP
ncbi:hypothetical protein Shyhy02_32000 [Streptomyces hygroscopicus subsp. hygroscopicus]|nr:hypothetical protein Shyhy02_32000 [Streptomyces hygroscopicus subsp. hygroscopicus]